MHHAFWNSKQPNQLFSGGLDRQVYLWDVNQPRPDDPISSLKFPDAVGAEGGKGSVYALAAGMVLLLDCDVYTLTAVHLADASGTLVAAGSPERIVRLWDPRTAGSQNGQSIAGLIGHTDNIRAILLSADGRHVRH
jgi:WD repeat-containing protein 48